MTDIFLSYSRADRPRAETMANALEADGFSVWWDKILRAGQTYDEVTETMLREAKVVIVLWSQTSVKSKWVRAEATLGQRNCELVPAMIEEAERPIMFELVQTADLIGWDGDRSETRWREFVDDIKRSLAKAGTSAPAPSPKPETVKASMPPPAEIQPEPRTPVRAAEVEPRKKSSSPLPMILGAVIVLGAGAYFGVQALSGGDSAYNLTITTAAAPASPECDVCPPMTYIEGGSFTIGSPSSETHHSGNEQPQTELTLGPYWIGQAEVTWSEWDKCVVDGGCRPAQGSGEAGFPVTGISWDDASAYAAWLSAQSGFSYRLPSEAEWEFAARGGTSSAYWWGENYPGQGVVTGAVKESSGLPGNAFGLSATLGNVREWAADCYASSYADLPVDGTARLTGNCDRRVVRGGSYRLGAAEHRAANRARYGRTIRDRSLGFRVVADQP